MSRPGIEDTLDVLIGGPRQPTQAEHALHSRWQFKTLRLAFDGDDDDARAIIHLLDTIQPWMNFVHNTDPKPISRVLVEAMSPTMSGMHETIDGLMALAMVRLSALGVEPPPHPEQDSDEPDVPNGTGYMPPIADAG